MKVFSSYIGPIYDVLLNYVFVRHLELSRTVDINVYFRPGWWLDSLIKSNFYSVWGGISHDSSLKIYLAKSSKSSSTGQLITACDNLTCRKIYWSSQNKLPCDFPLIHSFPYIAHLHPILRFPHYLPNPALTPGYTNGPIAEFEWQHKVFMSK